VEAAAGALRQRRDAAGGMGATAETSAEPAVRHLAPAPALAQLRVGRTPQRTIQHSTVMYGLGLHSGGRTGMVIQPLPPDSGLHLFSLPTGSHIPVHLGSVADTEYATTLAQDGAQVKTVEHFLSALHACGITNLLIKVHGELPVLDGSALDFCRTLEQIGIEDQGVPRRELVIDRRYEVRGNGDKLLSIEPAEDGETFSVSYVLRYPPPIGEQSYEFTCATTRPTSARSRQRAPSASCAISR
jgi:UDP-3-O-acyl-N-acetylglucosamine deacetylase